MSEPKDLPHYTQQPPPSWFDQELLAQGISLETNVLRALTLHGALVLASKHPEVQQHRNACWILQDMLDHLEAMFEELGLERPLTGWRGEA